MVTGEITIRLMIDLEVTFPPRVVKADNDRTYRYLFQNKCTISWDLKYFYGLCNAIQMLNNIHRYM